MNQSNGAQADALGAWGEQQAIERLAAEGYAIIDHGQTMGKNECDIIASKGGYIHFIEVKTRRYPDDDPLQAVNRAKQQRIARFADRYIRNYAVPMVPVLDVIAINGDPELGVLKYEHIVDAYVPRLSKGW